MLHNYILCDDLIILLLSTFSSHFDFAIRSFPPMVFASRLEFNPWRTCRFYPHLPSSCLTPYALLSKLCEWRPMIQPICLGYT